MVDTFRPLELGEGGRRLRGPGATPGPGRGPRDPARDPVERPGDARLFGARQPALRRVLRAAGPPPRVGVAIGDAGARPGRRSASGRAADAGALLAAPALNPFMAAGPRAWTEVRERITALARRGPRRRRRAAPAARSTTWSCTCRSRSADYVDFYSSEHHAANVGRMFRPGSEPLTPNWKHLPDRLPRPGRHGGRLRHRRSSGPPGSARPRRRRARRSARRTRLDIEAEVGLRRRRRATPLGEPVPGRRLRRARLRRRAGQRLVRPRHPGVGVQPLGPFLGKSFATSVSPWVVPLDALEAARVPAAGQDPPPLPYLRDVDDPWGWTSTLAVRAGTASVVSRPPFAADVLDARPAARAPDRQRRVAAHRRPVRLRHGLRPERGPARLVPRADLGRAEPITLADESTRTFLEDGDEVAITATAPGPAGSRIGFGEVRGRILPAH